MTVSSGSGTGSGSGADAAGRVQRLAIYGAGGFAREMAWQVSALERAGTHAVVGFVDDTPTVDMLGGKPVLSWEEMRDTTDRDTRIILAIGNTRPREAVAQKCRAAGFGFATLVHPGVELAPTLTLGEGCIVCRGSVLTVDIELGPHVHVNLNCTVGHDVRIGAFTTLSPGVNVSGNVHIGRHVFVGTGVQIINGRPDEPLVVADGCVIAAGACVTRSTEPDTLYAGVPAVAKKRYG